ncbi:PQQ-dependent sugar dehydrogenase [Psychrobacter aestuarii]
MTNTNTATATDSNSDNSTKANAQTSSAQDTAQKPAFTTKAIATFDEPWAMTALPTDTDPAPRLLVTEKSGNLFVVDTATGVKHRVAGVPKVAYGGQGGLGDVTLAPDFATTNAIYLSYVEKDANDDKYGAVVIKTTLSDLDTTSPKLTKIRRIWQQVPKISGQGHYSHRLLFSPDGQYLYISSGERQKKTPAQDMNANLGKIVRLNPDGSIPADNPFVKAASNAQANADSANKNKSTTPQSISAQIWTLGHRNVLGMQFDDAGRLWAHEMGPRGGDEFNLIEKGNNYGWPVVSNGRNYSGIDIPDHSTRPDFTAPQTSWTPVISPASMSFYQAGAQKDFPAWQNNMLISGLSSKSLVVVSIPTDENARDAQAKERYRYDMGERIRSVLSVDGMVWVLEDGSDGRLLRLLPE